MSESVETPVVPVITEENLSDFVKGMLPTVRSLHADAVAAAKVVSDAAKTDPAKYVQDLRDNPDAHDLSDEVKAQIAKANAGIEKIRAALDALLLPLVPVASSPEVIAVAKDSLKSANDKLAGFVSTAALMADTMTAGMSEYMVQEGLLPVKAKGASAKTGDGPPRPRIDPIVIGDKTFKTMTDLAKHFSTKDVKVNPSDIHAAWVAASGTTYESISGPVTFDFAGVTLTITKRNPTA